MTTLQEIILAHLPHPRLHGITGWELYTAVLNDWGSVAQETLSRNLTKLRSAGLVDKYIAAADEDHSDGNTTPWRFRRAT